ncbi:MAG: mechanosensitive ion channel [Betaproteobacteria bacterium]|nr:mechanosensitive ion channel [Betaproteobacteria bacterium]
MRAFVAALALAAVASAAPAQIPLPGVAAAPPKTEVKPAPDPRKQAEEQLAEARRRQAENRLEEGRAGADSVGGSDRQRLLDRLVALYGERLRMLDQRDSAGRQAAANETRNALMTEFSGQPPYPVVRLDLLREELDGMQANLANLESQLQAAEAQKAGFVDEQRRAAEALRLAEDRLARAAGTPAADAESRNRGLAELRLKVADGSLSNLEVGVEALREAARRQREEIAEVQAVVSRALPGQILGREQLDGELRRLRGVLTGLAAESDALVAESRKLGAERSRIAPPGAKLGPEDEQRVQLLDIRSETLRVQQTTLGWLQALTESAITAWQARFTAYSAKEGEARQQAIESMKRLREEVSGRKRIVDEMERAARAATREQEVRLESALLDTAAAARESAILDLLKQRALAYQRVDLAGARFERYLQRWLADLGVGERRPDRLSWSEAGARVAHLARRIWDFELFAVEDSTVVDGRTVTVSYGVTVGKSIGVLALFTFGYLAFSVLARWLQRLIVRRFGVDEQLAVVIRRWVMALAMVVLIVFVLNLARIPLTVFAFLGGALAIGIGFGTQTIIRNFISGIIILFERKIRVGDIVELNGITGHVTAVDMRASTVRGFNGVEALVPNSLFLENQVVNWTYSNPSIRREVKVGVAYGSSVRRAAEIVAGCAEDHGLVLKDPKPEVYFEDFGDSALMLTLVFWVEFAPGFNARRVDSDLRFAIDKRLADAGIAIPFPQRDVHLDLKGPLPVEIAGKAPG